MTPDQAERDAFERWWNSFQRIHFDSAHATAQSAWLAARAALAQPPADLPSLVDALDAYWRAAVAEGREGRTHDTEDGAAQRALHDVMVAIRAFRAQPPASGEVLTDAEIDRIQGAAYEALAKRGYTGGMGSAQWDRASARAIERAVLERIGHAR